MIIGLGTFGFVEFAGFVEYPPRLYWTQFCPSVPTWVPRVNVLAAIKRCQDAD